jgi:hypothetical protein
LNERSRNQHKGENMKVYFTENSGWVYISLIPENLEEASRLLRLSALRMAETPRVKTYFREDIHTLIEFKKRIDANSPPANIGK